eukprot:5509067-Amphidinium_carterae.1
MEELHQRHFLEDGAWACEPSLWMQWTAASPLSRTNEAKRGVGRNGSTFNMCPESVHPPLADSMSSLLVIPCPSLGLFLSARVASCHSGGHAELTVEETTTTQKSVCQ